MKVYLAAFGSGMGHASRMALVADRLLSLGDEVVFSSSGEVTSWLRNRGYACNDIPLVDVEFTPAGAFSATRTLNFLPISLKHLLDQVRLELKGIAKFSPEVVLSDSVASTVLAARGLGVRSAVLLNQLRLNSTPSTPRPIAMGLSAASVAIGNFFWGFCQEVLVPDLPPPYTISERNLWSAGASSERARYIGFMAPRSQPSAEGDLPPGWSDEGRRRRVFWQISGPPATRGPLLTKALRAAKALQDDYVFVITAGNPGGETSPTEVPGGFLYQWCLRPGALIDSCEVVVSRAGHVSLSEYILRARPSLLVPIPAQTEQIGNAEKAQRLGIAIALDEEALEPGALASSLRELADGKYARRAEEMKKVAEGYDAVGTLVSVLRSE